MSRMGCALALAAAIQPAVTRAQADASDQLYHVEMIVFAYTQADRLEEDFFHGIENPSAYPPPKRFELPNIPLESVFDLAVEPQTAFDEPTGAPAVVPGSPELVSGAVGDGAPGSEPAEPLADTTGVAAEALDDTIGDAAEAVPDDGLELIEPFADSERALQRPAWIDALPLPDGFRPLAKDELELDNARRRLENRRSYRVLRHVGWEQPGVDTDRSVAIDMRRLGITNPVGTIEVYRRRYLHVRVNLEYFDGEGTLWTAPAGPGLAPFEYAKSYLLVDERNAISSDELHYIDHPMFGILIQIRRAPERERGAAGPSSGPAG
jgi:hypothetical protein